jgi:hypothetical protein
MFVTGFSVTALVTLPGTDHAYRAQIIGGTRYIKHDLSGYKFL